MKMGLTFRGIHSGEFDGLVIKTKDRPIIPERKEKTFAAANRSGEYDFSGANIFGHEFYNDRVFKMEFQIFGADLADLRRKITKISRWILGEGDLIFDDSPLCVWAARVIDTATYMPENGGKKAVFIVSYRVGAFARLLFDSIDGPEIGMNIPIGSDIPIGIGEGYYTFSGEGVYSVYNFGDVYVRPVIEITGADGAVTVESGGRAIIVPGSCIIDCDKFTVTSDSGDNLMQKVTGEFFELKPGRNDITISTDESVVVRFRFYPEYIFDVDIYNTRIGGEDA